MTQIRPQRQRAAVVGLAFQYASVALSALQGFILVPLALHSIDTATYGAWLATGNVLGWLTFVDPGTQAVMRQRIGEEYGRGDKPALERAIGTGLLVNALLAAIFVLLGLAVSPGVAGFARAAPESAGVIARSFALAAVADGVMMAALGFGSVVVALMWYPALRGALYLAATLAGLGCSVILLLRGVGLSALPLGLLLRSLLLLLFEASLCALVLRGRLELVPRSSRQELRRLFVLSSTTWLSRIGGSVVRNLDGIVVARFAGPAAVTSMMVSKRAIDVVGLLSSRIGSVVAPGLAHLKGEADAERLRVVAARLLRAAGWVAALGLGGFVALDAAFVRLWVGPGLYAGDTAAALFGLLGFWMGLQALLAESAFAVGRIQAVSLGLLAESLLGAGLMLLAAALGAGLLAPALGGLLAALLLSGWLWARLFAGAMALAPGEGAQRARERCTQAVVALALGLAFYRVVPEPRGWPAFAAQAAAFALLELSASLVISPPLRGELRAALGALRRRRGHA